MKLSPLIETVANILRDTTAGDHAVEVALPDAPVTIEGTENELHRILLNLGLNAIQAMPAQGKLSFHLSTSKDSEDGQVHLSVRDTGVGIPPENVERIFDPFFTTKEVGEGQGLGLSIVHRLVQKNHGTIQVHSKPGAGTTFELTFRVANAS